MRDRDLYAKILGIAPPWGVSNVELDDAKHSVTVTLSLAEEEALACPQCRAPAPRYDARKRRWRHLDTCQFQTILEAEVPRVKCSEHGVHQVLVPWAEPGSHFTALLECLAIDWLKEASVTAVSRRLGLSWDELAGIMERAVRRGLARRTPEAVRAISVDETSFRKRFRYVTVVSDLERGKVLFVEEGREVGSLDRFYESLSPEALASLEIVAMDMSAPYIRSTRENVPDADRKIAFDKFHVMQMLVDAVNTVRKQEHREFRAAGDQTLTGTKYLWIQNPENFTDVARKEFRTLMKLELRVGRAWAIKQMARRLWHYVSRPAAEKAWKRLLGWAFRCRLEPMAKAARSIRHHLWGVLNAVVTKATSAISESNNAIIQAIKRKACGYRNPERFRNAIYFHLGGLDLYPRPALTHTNA
jgi:transposase